MKSFYYVDVYSFSDGGYPVKSRYQANCNIAIFIDEGEAKQYAAWRNKQAKKYGTDYKK